MPMMGTEVINKEQQEQQQLQQHQKQGRAPVPTLAPLRGKRLRSCQVSSSARSCLRPRATTTDIKTNTNTRTATGTSPRSRTNTSTAGTAICRGRRPRGYCPASCNSFPPFPVAGCSNTQRRLP